MAFTHLLRVSSDIQLKVYYLITSRYFHHVYIILFVQFVLRQLNLDSKINIAIIKFSTSNVTPRMLSYKFKKTVEILVTSEKVFVFINTHNGTSAFWKRFQLEVLAMIRQLGCPTLFMTLYVDLHWNNLIANIFKLKRQNISEEDIKLCHNFRNVKF